MVLGNMGRVFILWEQENRDQILWVTGAQRAIWENREHQKKHSFMENRGIIQFISRTKGRDKHKPPWEGLLVDQMVTFGDSQPILNTD